MSDNEEWAEQYRLSATKWVDAEAAATILEDLKSAFLSQEMGRYPDLAVNRAEQIVKSSSQWRDYIEKMIEARKKANLAKVEMEYRKMKFMEWQSYNATRRAEMRL